jgi:Tol biopolymer transport system component
MGEVYRARDTKLGREVAIKVLPRKVTSHPASLARFAREARMLATLNHPHIGAIYGFVDSAPSADSGQPAVRALVLELVEGETLAEPIRRGAVPVDKALGYARQIAAALDAAHEKGIVHRDLKPANIKVTPDGAVKVLDFGLAKAALDDGATVLSNSPTIDAAPTLEGTILGTPAYMSPEQARGEPVDKRTDIWAFGCVLYELLTGRSLFARNSVADTLAVVVAHEPDFAELPSTVPPGVRDLLRRCLEKDVRRRLRDIGDASVFLDAPAAIDQTEPVVARRSSAWSLAWMLAGGLLAAALLGIWSLRPATAPPQIAVQRLTDFVGMEESPAASPDGKTIAFVVRSATGSQIWMRLLAAGVPVQITRDAGDHEQPRWTPDSSSLIYFTPSSTGDEGTLWEVPALPGGERRRLASAASGADISHDGRYLATLQLREDGPALTTLTRDGAQTVREQPLASLGGSVALGLVRWSPDDRWVAFQPRRTSFNERIFVVPASGGEPVEVTGGTGSQGFAWLPDSSGLVYASAKGSTMPYPPVFNLRTVARDGTGDRQLTFGEVSYSEPDVTASGTVVASRTHIHSDIWRFPIQGSPADNTRAAVRVTWQTGLAQTPSVSPDDQELAFLSDSGGHANIWVARTDGSALRPITFERDPDVTIGVPTWSSGGQQIAFVKARAGTVELWLINSDGGGLQQIVPMGAAASWSSDDQWLYYTKGQCIEKMPVQGGAPVSVRCDDNAGSPAIARRGSALYYVAWLQNEIRRADPEGGASVALARVPAARVPGGILNPDLSPDDAWLAMPLKDGATTNLWLQPTAGGPMKQITDFERAVDITRRASWSRDGRFLYAAVGELDADVVRLDGLLTPRGVSN